jgi:hypothetical protein
LDTLLAGEHTDELLRAAALQLPLQPANDGVGYVLDGGTIVLVRDGGVLNNGLASVFGDKL